MGAMTEKALQEAILKFARQRHWLCFHTYDSRRSAPGFPDLCMVRKKRLIFAELKSEKGKLTKDQALWRETLINAGQPCYLWRPDDLEIVFKVLA